MKKFLLSLAAAGMAFSFGACSKNDDDVKRPDEPANQGYDYGVFIVNAGSMYSNIDGSLSYIEFGSGDVFDNIFKEANGGATVGDTFNSGFVAGDNIYLAVTDSKVLHIIDRHDFKVKKTISMPEGGPRQITSYNDMIYVTLFGQPGYVAEVDPVKMEVTRTLEVGPLPEYIVPFNGMLYVAVSDGYDKGPEACVAVIDPKSFTVTERIYGTVNPVNLVTNGSKLYVCAWGQYMSEPPYSQYDFGIYEISNNKLSEKICDGTFIDIHGNKLYYINNPYGSEEVGYGVIDTRDNTSSTWIESKDGVDSPIALGVDPVNSDVIILSYELGEGGYASYATPGYARRYKADGTVVATYTTGVGPTNMFFNVSE